MQNTNWKAQPIFVSSTFTDMMAERDILRDFVFKELDEKLNERRVRLEPIDLRWGVETTSEMEQENKELMVLKVCLDEIDRCAPFFIGIIGDRYGWIPPAKRMANAEREKGFESEIENKSVTALEIEYGVFASKAQKQRSFFFFREPLPFDKIPEDKRTLYSDKHNPEFDPEETEKRLNDFKELIISKVGKENVFTYKADWVNGKVTGLAEFQQKVIDRLWKELDSETKDLEDKRPKTWQDEERKYLSDFTEERTISFSGRADVINDLKIFANSDAGYDNWGLCLTGESGSGKSTLFAKIYKELRKQKDIFVLGHASGISLRSNSLMNMLTLWIEELADELKIDVSNQLEGNPKFDDLTKLFAELLSRTAVNKRVIVLVDALNQFENTAHAKHVNWLPELIHANAKFIFTAIEGEETNNLAKRKGITVEELKPVNRADAEEIIAIICKRYHKTLNQEAVEILLDKKIDENTYGYSNPLWLTMAVDEFILLDEDDFDRMKGLEGTAEEKLKQLLLNTAEKLPADITGMYNYVFNRCKRFGDEFVNAILSYIGISRNGLRESDLEKLIDNYANTEWDILNFASLRRYLRTHIVSKGELGLWDFRHIQVRESFKKTILANEKEVTTLHKNLAEHLEQVGNKDSLHLTEIMWHLFKCDNKKKASEIYGSNGSDNYRTGEYSISLRDILLEKEANIEWVSSLVEEAEIGDSVKNEIVNNVHFNLEERIENHIPLNPRLKILMSLFKIVKQLSEQNPHSAKYARSLSVSYDKIGNIYKALGDTNIALQSYECSLKLDEELLKRNPDSADYTRNLSISYEKIGNIYNAHGNTQSALQSFESSLKLREELRKRNPDSAKYAMDLSISYDRIGDIYKAHGDTKSALQSYESSLRLREELRKRNPNSEEYARGLSVSYDNIGTIYTAHGDTQSALKSHESQKELVEELLKQNPDSAEYTKDLSISYGRIGDIYKALGDTNSALQSYENSLNLRKELLKRNPDSADYIRRLSISYNRIGDIYKALGDTKSALQSYESSLKLAEELLKRNPDSAVYALDLSDTYDNIGDINTILCDTKSALQWYENSLKLREELLKRNPDSAEYAGELSVSYKRIGDINKALGDTKTALQSYENSLKLREELHKRNPKSADYARNLSISYEKIGDIYTALGDTQSALHNFESSLKLREELRKRNPDSAVYARSLSISYERMGDIYKTLGDTKTALQSYESSLGLREELRKRNPDSAKYAGDLSISYDRVGDINTALGDTQSALKSYESSLRLREELRKRNPDSAEYARDLSLSYNNIGDINTALGDTQSALQSYESSLKLREELRNRNPDSAKYARDLVVSYYKMQKKNDLLKALLYMKERNLLMDPSLVNLCKQFGIE